jgi:hypothetical protein
MLRTKLQLASASVTRSDNKRVEQRRIKMKWGLWGGGGIQPAYSVTETVIGFPAGQAFGSARVQFNENGATRDDLRRGSLTRLPLSLFVHFALPFTVSLSEHSFAAFNHIQNPQNSFSYEAGSRSSR